MSERFAVSGNKVNYCFDVVLKQLETEANHLLDMAELEVMRLIRDGMTPNQAKQIVMGHIQNGTGFAQAFWNRQNALIRTMENELVAVPVNEYGKYHPNTRMKWVLGEVVTHHCHDCLQLSMMEPQTLAKWEAMETGLPRQGKTACSYGCQCMLEPVGSTKSTSKTISGSGQNKQTQNPVSSSLKYDGAVPEYKDVVRRVLKAIDNIHDDGELNLIPIQFVQMDDPLVLGAYHPGRIVYRDQNNKIIRTVPAGHHIEIGVDGNTKNFTLTHEIGHFIDQIGIGTKGKMSSLQSPLLNKWREAVLESKQYNYLVKELDRARTPDRLQHLYYCLELEELWARSYAQYIAQKSGNSVLLKELEYSLSRSKLYQWNKKDFERILKAFDEIFTEMGWLL